MMLEANKRETGSSVFLIFDPLLISQLLASNFIGSGSTISLLHMPINVTYYGPNQSIFSPLERFCVRQINIGFGLLLVICWHLAGLWQPLLNELI